MTEVRIKHTSAPEVIEELSRNLSLGIPDPFEVEIEKSWSGESLGKISFKAQYSEVPEHVRRELKANFNLDVPSWQKESSSDKDIEGSTPYKNWQIKVYLTGAFTCEIIETKEKPACEINVERAEKIENLTVEQLRYLVLLEAARLRAPQPDYVVECKPA
jgi:hypothetical protein